MRVIALRDYQREAVDAVYSAWRQGVQRPAVVLPTGMGKTVIFAEIARRELEGGGTPLVLVPRRVLVDQTVSKIRDAAPSARIGVIQAERHETRAADVLVASTPTLARAARRDAVPPGSVSCVIVDEAHFAAADSYVHILRHFGCFDATGGTPAVGLSATLSRSDTRSLSDIWDTVVYSRSIPYGVIHGHLVDVRGITVQIPELDMTTVRVRGGDYLSASVGAALSAAAAPPTVAAAYRTYATREDGSLRPGILFAPTVASAREFADAFAGTGIPTGVITGATPAEDRQHIIRSITDGDLTVIASCMALTTGFDLPELEVAVMLRMTTSPALYVQMAGRVLRPVPAVQGVRTKTSALILDCVGVAERHPLATTAALGVPGGIRDGETLRAAIQRAQDNPESLPTDIPMPSQTGDVDLFQARPYTWLQTPAGFRFIPTGTGTVFVWEVEGEAGRYRVGRSSTPYVLHGPDAGWLVDTALSLPMAMAWAEEEAGRLDPTVASRTSRWRTKRSAPSLAQTRELHRLGIPTSPGMTRAEASDALSIYHAARILDPPEASHRKA